MKSTWIIEEKVLPKELENGLVAAIKDLGMEVVFANIEEDLEVDDNAIPYGSVNFVTDFVFVPEGMVYFNKMAFSWGELSKNWGKYLLNSKHVVTTMGCFKDKLSFFYENFGINGLVFMKPYLSDKSFNAQLFHEMAAYDTLSIMGSRRMNLHDQTLVVVAEPKVLQNEWRFFIADRKVIASSQYNKDRKPHREEGCNAEAVLGLLDRVLKDEWQPHRAYVVDLCESEGKPYVIEIGCVNCSDLYAADKKSFVEGIGSLV